jgi:hypothetical protein
VRGGREVRRHCFNPVSRRWEFVELPTTDEEAIRFLGRAPESERCLKTYRDWRFGLGASVEQALLRTSALACELDECRRPQGEPEQ